MSRKARTLPCKITGVEKIPSGNFLVTVNLGQPRGHFIRVLNERNVNDGGDFCLLWLVILKSTRYSVGDTS